MNEPAGALGATPLMVAAWHGSFDAMDALVRRGAMPGRGQRDPKRPKASCARVKVGRWNDGAPGGQTAKPAIWRRCCP